jgi:5-methylcytosine-specific restriction endonuclease McrA
MIRMPYKDPERRRAYGRDWMRRNGQKARDGMQRWRKRHPEEHRAEGRAYYARNRARVDRRNMQYLRSNPQVARAKWENYRARRRAGVGSFSGAEWLALVRSYGGRCAYCGLKTILVVEHCTPLSRGGLNSIDNIVPACRSCNARKHQLTENEFVARLRSDRRRVRPALRRSACPLHHVVEEPTDEEHGQQA